MKLGDARVFSVPTFSSDSAPRASTAVDRWVAGRIRASVPSARLRFVLWDGFELPYAGDAPVGTIVFRNRRALFSWVWNPDLNFGEAYMFGAVDLQGDLVAMLCEIYRALRRTRAREQASSKPVNDEHAARENVHRHYDLGNDFYRLWLDREMLYTCAYFPSPDATLEDAQIAKMERVCRKLNLRPGERVIEAGCGWGSLALFMAKQYGVSVRAFNVSSEQIAYARARAKEGGLAGQVEFVEDDYRNVRGQYDVFVSVGMLEHVGLGDYEAFGSRRRALADGRGPRVAALHRTEPARRAQPVDPEADFSRRVSTGAARSVRARAATVEHVGARRGESPAALCVHARPLAPPLRDRIRRGGADVRRDVRPRVAPLPRGIAGRVHHGHDATVPGGLRARRQQRNPLDASLLSPCG